MNPSPKKPRKQVIFGRKMVPWGLRTVLNGIDLRIREFWNILIRRKKIGNKKKVFDRHFWYFRKICCDLVRIWSNPYQSDLVRVWPNPYQNPTKKVTVSFFEQLRCVQKIQAPSPDIQMTSGLFYSKSMYQETCGKLFCGHEINGERPQQTGIFFRYHFSRICCTHLPAEGAM